MLSFLSFVNNQKEILKSFKEEYNKLMRVRRGFDKPKKPEIKSDLKFKFYFIY